MSGPIGVVATKIVLSAGMLLLSARIDLHSVSATIEPSAPVTIVTPDLAERLGVAGAGRGMRVLPDRHVVGLDHSEVSLREVVVSDDAGVVIGADLLRQMPLALDFRRGRLRVVDPDEYRRMTEAMVPVPVAFTTDGCASIAGNMPDGRPVMAALVDHMPSDASDVTSLGTHEIVLEARAQSADRRLCPANDLLVDWNSFNGRVILLDFGRNRIWLPRNAW